MRSLLLRIFLILSSCLFVACTSQSGGLLRLDPGPDQTSPSPLVANDPEGPIPAPSLPPDIAALAAKTIDNSSSSPDSPSTISTAPVAEEKFPTHEQPQLQYTLVVLSPDVPELESAFRAASHLEMLRDKPLTSFMSLDQRMRSDLETALEVLRSFGYYAGKSHGAITRQPEQRQANHNALTPATESTASAYVVTITFEPGMQYLIGKTRVSVTEPERLLVDDAQGRRRAPAKSLTDVDLPEGAPAMAGNVLDAVSAVRENFRDRGYPFATIASSRYTVDHGAQTLDAEVIINSGPHVVMNGIEIKGESPVHMKYLEALSTWRPGIPWNQNRVEDFRNALRQSGLFSSAELNPAEIEDAEGRRAVLAELTPAPPRTVGGALKYDTGFGPGIQAYWEHRNITGRGDSLRIETPIWADLQELAASYRLPFFKRNDQDFTAKAAFRKEDTDAYKLTSYLGTVGLERRFSRRLIGSVEAHLEMGALTDPDEATTDYTLVGLPVALAYNNANSLLNATRGFRLNLALAPYAGEYHKDFTVLRSRIEAQAFLPVIGKESLVLALRAMYGMISDTTAQDVPASIRFYAGGGGSVRGYEFQSLGPRNDSHDPLGGASAMEFSGEARIRFDETWGLVAFLDGGMAYEDAVANFNENELRWGAGIGLRVYTAIGPVRLDFAVPLNPRKDDSNYQIYFSIGQNF